jgi:hypothetical protein
LGLPRSGTTLVDRILSSHSQVASLGETNDFVNAVMSLAGPAKTKDQLIEATAHLDFAELGQSYCVAQAGHGQAANHLIDKTPSNFLYLGLIAKALPDAKVIHLQRNPMDSCFGMYKALFRMGYPFSYDLGDLAKYYLAYRNLMDHWRKHLPGRLFDLQYEALVKEPEENIRQLLGFCGLQWEDGCLNFHENQSPSATASAAQIRQPMYKSAVERWRHYEHQLEPLKHELEAGGIKVS